MAYIVLTLLYVSQLGILTFWLVDILDMPFMEMFDTEIPLNGLFWILFYVLYCFNISTFLGTKGKRK